ncbi:MAG: phage tail sheath family protein [Alphaproteobacteria bacterium]|nr:phage tail sheath family protein [Alphaproteobacteria bacterium]
MKPGISVQHTALPTRRYGLVRCDIAGIIGFIPKGRWPVDAVAGDFVELTLRRTRELLDHPLRRLFDPASRRAVQAFFDNGGDQCHLFGVCIEAEEDVRAPTSAQSVLGPLLERLRGEEEIALLAVPGAAYLRVNFSRSGKVFGDADALYLELLNHCVEMNNRFLVIDAPRGLHGEGLAAWLANFREQRSDNLAFGAVYYPWLRNGDELMAPSGAILGVFARTEREHSPFGVVWPPANVPVHGVTHPDVELRWDEVGTITQAGANPIVAQPGRGVVVFGARTLSNDPRWEFINSRRIVSLVAEQLRRDNEWVVFEHNNQMMWKVLERDVSARLAEFWEAGMLTGDAAGKDYLVRCDEETNTKEDREAGRLHVQVLLRPINTTEHITIDLRLGEGEV